MVAEQQSQHTRGGYGPRLAQRQPDNGPKPKAKETGTRIWRLVHSYRVGETFSNTTAVAQIPGGCLVRTCSRNARGCAEALVFVPGATAADFGLAQNGGGR